MSSGVPATADDIGKLDILLKKLIDSKKITKKQLIQKLMSVNEGNDQFPQEESLTENILDGESEEDQNRVPRDASHRNQISNTNSNFYKFTSQD